MGTSIQDRHQMFPAVINISICHSDYFSMNFNKKKVKTIWNSSLIHSQILDEAANGQLREIGNDLELITEGMNEEHIPTYLYYETYMDTIISSGIVIDFKLNDGTQLSLTETVVSYEPASGWLRLFSEIKCKNELARRNLERKLRESGWVE